MGRKRIYDVKENYFETWSHEMAYILGFISADGSVDKNELSLSIELQTRDIEILEFIRQQIAPTVPIKTTKKKEKEYNRLRICSKHLIQSLQKYNVIPNKTFTIKLDFDIPAQFFGDYLRGLFDGDGCVHCRRNTIEFGLCSGSREFLDEILNRLGFGRVRTMNSKKKKSLFNLDAEANSAIAIRDIMYSSGGFALQRKKDIFFSEFHIPSSRWWTPEQIQFLQENYVHDQSPQIIADKIGKSYKAISKKIWELKLSSRFSNSNSD